MTSDLNEDDNRIASKRDPAAAGGEAGLRARLTDEQYRITQHKIADNIYENLTRERGVYSNRIA